MLFTPLWLFTSLWLFTPLCGTFGAQIASQAPPPELVVAMEQSYTRWGWQEV